MDNFLKKKKGWKFMNKIVLNDGTEIENGLIAIDSPKQIFVSIPGTNIVEATLRFCNHENTKVLICYDSIYKRTFKGFTHFSSVYVNTDQDVIEMHLSGDEVSVKTEYTVPEIYLPEEMRHEEEDEENGNESNEST